MQLWRNTDSLNLHNLKAIHIENKINYLVPSADFILLDYSQARCNAEPFRAELGEAEMNNPAMSVALYSHSCSLHIQSITQGLFICITVPL